MFSRKYELDSIAVEVLRAVFAQCPFRFGEGGKFSFQLPARITVNQQIRIAMPLREATREYRERVVRQLEGVESFGKRIADILRLSLSNPLVFLAGKSPFDGYLTVCRNSGMHWGIVRALQYLRDVITVTEEKFFTDPTKISVNWRLHLDRITPAMLQRVEKCLRQVDEQALFSPGCNQWLKSIQQFFKHVKAGTFRLPGQRGAARTPAAAGGALPGGEGGSSLVPAAAPSPPVARRDSAAEGLGGFRDGSLALRQYLLPHYLDLAPGDFSALCRCDQGAGDFARRLGGAIERFSVRCLDAARREFLEACAAPPASDKPAEEGAAEIGKCVRQLAEEAATFRSWLERELPQGENTVGRHLMELAESSLISGLFFLFLQQRFGELFREDRGDARRRAETEPPAARQTAVLRAVGTSLAQQRLALPALVEKGELPAIVLDVAARCENALARLADLFAIAAGVRRREGEETPVAVGKFAHRFLSAAATCVGASDGPPDFMTLAEYEPGEFPAARCHYFRRAAGPGAVYEQARVCRFSRRGGVTLSADIAIPVAAFFGSESRLAQTAEYLGSEADRQLAQWRQMARISGVRQCLPYVENHGAQVARIEICAADPGSNVSLLALPTAAMATSDDFAENTTLTQAIERAAVVSPARETLLRAVEMFWRERSIAPSGYSLCPLVKPEADADHDKQAVDDELRWRRKVRHFLNQKNRWPIEEAEAVLKVLGIVIEPKSDGAPHGKVRLGERHHTLSSKLLKDGQVYANYLYEWIHTLGQERLLAELLERKDPRLAPYMRKADAGEE
jgi:hypothetical protein